MPVPTPLRAIVEALRSAGATEEIIAAVVKAGGGFGDSPRRRGGRPRLYADRAARDRAYRAQKKPRDETRVETPPRDEMRVETQRPRRRVTKFETKFHASGRALRRLVRKNVGAGLVGSIAIA